MKIITVMSFAVLAASSFAWADKTSECTRLWQLEKETGCPATPPDTVVAAPSVAPTPVHEHSVVRSDFGPSKCAVDDALDHEKHLVKKECDDWLKERKADIGKDYYITGTCNASCAPCPSSSVLSQCSYKGEVHFIIK